MQQPVCYQDLKTYIQNYIHHIWQETWDQQNLNKLHSIHPSTSYWAALPVRRHDVRLTRLRIGHTRVTHRHLLLGENAPECPPCKVPYSAMSEFGPMPLSDKNVHPKVISQILASDFFLKLLRNT
ncbi:RNase H domain-containing protein [Trichonephila clavipes]|nr:RNase H domain-containing protein [Trichonephila clavipes]